MKKLIFGFCLLAAQVNGQDDLLNELEAETTNEDQVVFATFKAPYLVNSHTTEMTKQGLLDFRIIHRFGDVSNASSLFGLDDASNIRFSFDYGITDNLQVGLGRSKTNQHIDGFVKYRLLEQTTKSVPVSLALLTGTAFTPQKDNLGVYTKTAHRFSYSSQIIIARKFNDWLSLGINPTYVHRNLVTFTDSLNPTNNATETNGLFALGTSGRLKLTKRLALVGEYYYTFSAYRKDNPNFTYNNPLSLGVEIETGGHVFHINLSNASGIIANDFIPSTTANWLEGNMMLGFTISRVFVIQQPKND